MNYTYPSATMAHPSVLQAVLVNLMKEIFDRIVEHLKENLSPNEFNLWIKDLRFSSSKDRQTFFLRTSSQFKAEKIAESYLPTITDFFRGQGADFKNIDLKVKVDTVENASSQERSSFVGNSYSQGVKFSEKKHSGEAQTKIKPLFTFENFIECKFNQTAYTFCKKVTQKLGIISPLYIYGHVGTRENSSSPCYRQSLHTAFSISQNSLYQSQ